MVFLRRLFALLAPYDCLVCGREGPLLCIDCLPGAISLPATPPLPSIYIGADYSGPVRQVLHLYKFERARDAAPLLAMIMDQALPLVPPDTLITYVPTASSRIRQRGYDHARELAMALACRRGLKSQSLLIRRGQQRQVGTNKAARRQQAAANYLPVPGLKLEGRTILLVDDVLTTGATLQAAIKVLVEAGAKSVEGLVVASKR